MFEGFKKVAVAAVAGFVFSIGSANAAIIGHEATDRGSFDSYSNFGLALTDVVSPISGTIKEYEVFASAGDLALLVLRPTATSNEFTLVGFDAQTAVAGFQAFSTSLAIQAGDILGLFLGSGKVSYELDSTPNVCNSPNCDVFFTNNGGIPNLGNLLNTTIGFGGSTDRTYSVNASVVPIPATAWMLIAAIGGLALIRRREPAA